MKLVLASKSPRRMEILQNAGYEFEICPSEREEVKRGDNPEEIVKNLARDKAEEIYGRLSDGDITIIGADTIVVSNGEILGKPHDEADAFRILRLLSGNTHVVMTGVCILTRIDGKRSDTVFVEKTRVTFYELTDDEINEYIASGDPFDKAGAYGIQGVFGKHIRGIEGDYYNVVGLPIGIVYRSIKHPSFWDWMK